MSLFLADVMFWLFPTGPAMIDAKLAALGLQGAARNSRCTVVASYENARGRVVDDTDTHARITTCLGSFGWTAEKARIACDVSALQDALSHI